jgi:hypothetical protein
MNFFNTQNSGQVCHNHHFIAVHVYSEKEETKDLYELHRPVVVIYESNKIAAISCFLLRIGLFGINSDDSRVRNTQQSKDIHP